MTPNLQVNQSQLHTARPPHLLRAPNLSDHEPCWTLLERGNPRKRESWDGSLAPKGKPGAARGSGFGILTQHSS